ncbi:MAG: putative rane protein [Enterococcus sp.]|uniref:DUF1304 domain-containing protein n=1 Tax=Enterococcus sp. TaxID=35783 RepID=UPI00258C876A|nr:DUF1304 domain-containing protein [Enterococcus sp.]MDK2844966.1 putative rane protein [Enterococcus sp.]
MLILFKVLVVLVALEFLYIMYLETFATTSDKTAQTFKMTVQELQNKNVQTLFKNQGIYNGLIALGLLCGLFFVQNGLLLVRFLLVYIILVAVYGAYSSDKSILLKQGGLAIIAFIVSLFLK